MNKNELKLGNFVKVNPIAKSKEYLDHVFEIGEMTTNTVSFKDFYGIEYYSELNPVPLTEEWLLDLGFKENSFSYIFELNGIGIIDNVLRISYNDLEIKVDYVHQLQNLYFALKGKELESKKFPKCRVLSKDEVQELRNKAKKWSDEFVGYLEPVEFIADNHETYCCSCSSITKIWDDIREINFCTECLKEAKQ